MKERKLNYRFHNPNPTAATADYLLKIFMEANQEKVQLAIQAAANGPDGASEKDNGGHISGMPLSLLQSKAPHDKIKM